MIKRDGFVGKYVVKIGYYKFIFDSGEDALAFAETAAEHSKFDIDGTLYDVSIEIEWIAIKKTDKKEEK